jgi:nucleoside-diphosphate-sugar epimerase
MKVLFIGGTGNISTETSRLAVEKGMDLYLLNRGNRKIDIPGAKSLICDISDPKQTATALAGQEWDCVVNWIGFETADVERDIALFKGKTKQYIYISSASAYQKPPKTPFITEETPLENPFWDYSRKKAASEKILTDEADFPITIVRPSLTYDTVIPVALGSWTDYTIIDRMKQGKPVIVHGDGTSLWTITHSKDFAKGFVGLIGNEAAIGEAFHITSDELLTWDQIYQAVAAAAGVEANIVHVTSDFIGAVAVAQGQDWLVGNFLGDKSVSAIFDNSKIKKFVPEFEATIPFAEGIKETVKWFEADPERMEISDFNNGLIDSILAAYQVGLDAIK